MHIGNRMVGGGAPCFVTAELGINPNGSVDTARQLILAAKKAGADAVKFQKRTVNVVYSPEELAKPRLIPPENGILRNAVRRGVLPPDSVDRLEKSGYTQTTNGDLKLALEFTRPEYQEIIAFCQEQEIIFFASPWDDESIYFLEQFNVPCHKVASACLTDEGLLRRLRATEKPIILATGMSTMDEIRRAVTILGTDQLILLHSVSTYPSHNNELNLAVIKSFQTEHFLPVPIGYSGHEKGILPSIVAVALGAVMIERHLTLDRTMWGSDHPASLEPKDFQELVESIRLCEMALGDGVKRVLPREAEVMKKLRRKFFDSTE